ncbi:acetyl-CoA carboxylase, carboxyltransferase component (subunits alpha and beta) [Desulfosporosinus orientis DSM 765]|uniref:Acetyl-CoA carboxylase, carboxyltransferase component (Subunits alpha and beta) n=1 Tax=Desulfosporosinus orientis (strain ATCC 19365 / DSM 765 / NCIMB 8382 / VKM B-1628 / Singapore I) TaxID=768706 RepID=G7WIA9_DESOD|nr:carboxyl transferase domain-containing protein [Desulfosporosinus orientis]AET68557.1 acetyl-CoA carboxylase, carboxyltransferase component (subunits alpha and beta) [Desulfosporosinus orientis DSM 765]
MDIYAKLSELTALQEATKLGGGVGRIIRQHENGKMTARERIDVLLDVDSFIETDTFIKGEMTDFTKPDVVNVGEGVVTGYGTIHGRLVYIFSQDFTVFGGALGDLHSRKICKIMDLALKNGAPVIGLNDSGGARIQEGVSALSAYGDIFYRNTLASGVIPQISVIMGPCAGGAVYSPAITDFTFMVDKTSQMFITGPQVIKSVTGEEVTTKELGGAMVHNHTSGVAHFLGQSETDTLEMVRHLLTYLPQNNLEESPILEGKPPKAEDDDLLNVVPIEPNKQYDVRDVLYLLVDGGEFFEVHQRFAQNIVTCFARFEGMAVGIVANQPAYLAGCLDIDASDKLSRFVRFCDCFNIPLITFVDVPGFLPGVDQEYRGIIRHGAKILYAYSEATVPKITIILRKAYGGAYVAMCSRSLGADVAVAWPTAEIAVMGPDGAANIIFREEIMKSADPKATMKQRTEEYREKFANPYIASAKGLIDNIIDPRDTRKMIIQSLNMLNSKREAHPRKKHGNIPF